MSRILHCYLESAALICLMCGMLLQTGCVLAPAIDSFHRAGLTKSDRMQLLGKQVKEFDESLKWGDAETAMRYVEESKQLEIRPILESMLDNQQVVESKIVSSVFSDSAYEATIRLKVKSFKVPYYIVGERFDEQRWEFDMSGGWKLVSITKGDA